MNKLVTVLGVAAVATLAGCKDPNYKPMSASQNDVKVVEPVTCKCPPGMKHETPCACGADDCQCVVEVKPVEPPKPICSCAPGTKHEAPCGCGASDCKCIIEVKSVTPPPPPAPVEPEFTVYTVQGGDYLAKISKKFNVTIDSIKRMNDLKSDTIRVGQKLKIPGKHVVPAAPVVAKSTKAAATSAKKGGFEPYKGATKEYVVKNGDTLGAIAYGNGCNIRQLKALNNLQSDVVKVGQKLKVPAEGKAPAKKVEEQKINEAQSKVAPAGVIANDPTVEPALDAPAAEAPAADAPVVDTPADIPAPVEAVPTQAYTVQEGDDMTGVSIRFCVSAAEIRELNNLPEDAQLTPGQVIKLPADAQQ